MEYISPEAPIVRLLVKNWKCIIDHTNREDAVADIPFINRQLPEIQEYFDKKFPGLRSAQS